MESGSESEEGEGAVTAVGGAPCVPTPLVNHMWIRTGHYVKSARERYLRTDLPCHTPHCTSCRHLNSDAPSPSRSSSQCLPEDVTHYVAPCADILENYLDIMELPELRGILIAQSVALRCMHSKGGRHLRRILNLNSKGCVSVLNLIHAHMYTPQIKVQTLTQWEFLLVYQMAKYYLGHGNQNLPIIILTNQNEFCDEFGSRVPDLFVISLDKYLRLFWPDLSEARELYEAVQSCKAAENGNKVGDSTAYSEYMPRTLWERGTQLGQLLVGTLRVNRFRSLAEAFVTPHRSSFGQSDCREGVESVEDDQSGGLDDDVLICDLRDRNRAIHGDEVVVRLHPKDLWREKEDGSVMRRGEVIAIAQRRWRDCVATLEFLDGSGTTAGRRSERLLAVPYDIRIPKIRLFTSQSEQLSGQRILVRLDDWPTSSGYPNGHLVKVLGPAGNLDTDIGIVLIENGLDTNYQFSDRQLADLPNESAMKFEVGDRRDLRTTHLIFSIDPPGCVDVDDAISIRLLPSGQLELGVHIADVTAFLPHNSTLDLEARRRGTTVYLADRRCDMLPELLATNLCSLWSGVDRYAVSVLFTLDPSTHDVLDVWYGRTMIQSSFKLQYAHAEMIYGLPNHGKVELGDDFWAEIDPKILEWSQEQKRVAYDELHLALSRLVEIAAAYNSRRHGVELEDVEVTLDLTPTPSPENASVPGKVVEGVRAKEPLLMHQVVAELMILANQWVARRIVEAFPQTALIRTHPPPVDAKLERLRQLARVCGYSLDTGSSASLADSLDRCADQGDPWVNKVFRMVAVRAMQQASYVCSGGEEWGPGGQGHYGLALEVYTHFTSPIRRYPDVVVHRLLLAALSVTSNDSTDIDKEQNLFSLREMEDLCAHVNVQHRSAQNAQRESVQLFQALYFRDLDPSDSRRQAEGIIYAVRSSGVVDVFLPTYGFKGPCYLTDPQGLVLWLPGSEFTAGRLELSPTAATVHTVHGEQRWTLFQHVTVTIDVVESKYRAPSIKLNLVSDSRPLASSGESGAMAGHLTSSQLMREVVDKLNQVQVKDSEKEDVGVDSSGTPPLDTPFQFFYQLKMEFWKA